MDTLFKNSKTSQTSHPHGRLPDLKNRFAKR